MESTKNILEKSQSNVLIPLVIFTLLFLILGFVMWLNGPLIPFFEIACYLSAIEACFIVFTFYIAYFIMAIPSSWIIEKVGCKNGISLGLMVIAIGAFMFYPAAEMFSFLLLLVALFIMCIGLSILQNSGNYYVNVVKSREIAATRISLLGIANKLGGFIAPLVLNALVLSNIKEYTKEKAALLDEVAKSQTLDSSILQLEIPYLYLGLVFFVLAVLAKLSPLSEIDLDKDGYIVEKNVYLKLKKILNKKIS